jgi:hypothetical protein
MNPLPPMLAYRLARANQLTVARVQELWQQWLVQFRPIQRVIELSWSNVPDCQDALASYQAWTGGLLPAEASCAQDFANAYFWLTTGQLAQRAWAAVPNA